MDVEFIRILRMLFFRNLNQIKLFLTGPIKFFLKKIEISQNS